MKFLDKLERKIGKYAINNLITYILVIYFVGTVINFIDPNIYGSYLMLDVEKVLQGQIWRLFTFSIQPVFSNNIFFLFFQFHLYYMIGNSLEDVWGAFKFNLYFFSGIILNILAIFLVYFITGDSYVLGLQYINRSMFFAFALIFPNVQFLLFFFIPVKVKYLAIFYAVIYVVEIVQTFTFGFYHMGIAILISLGNFLIYFFNTRNYKQYNPKEIKRRRNFKKEIKQSSNRGKVISFNGRKTVTMHKCTVCERTEADDEDLEFRFCSKCNGNYEYCMEHLFTHEHKT